jgi:DNA invertase Pin-like site-specific DNA recombinase
VAEIPYKSIIKELCENCGAEVSLYLVSLLPPLWKGKCESCGHRMAIEEGPKVFGYLRGSLQEPDLEKHQAEILAYANEHKLGKVDWVEEKVSRGKPWQKRDLALVVDTLNKGDGLIVPDLASLGRSTLDVLDCLALLREKGVNVYDTKGAWTPTALLEPQVFRTMVTLFSEIERDITSARAKEGLQARREAGVKLGRPKGPGKSKLDKYRPEIEALLKTGSTLKYIARRFGSSEANLINWLNKNKIDRKPEYGQE